jgi:predicted metal-dependent hydrolase
MSARSDKVPSQSLSHEYRLIRSRRRTLALVVTSDGELQVRAPMRATQEQIRQMLAKHDGWIRRKKAEQASRRPAPVTFAEGETFPVNGQWLPLQFGNTGRASVVAHDDALIVARRLHASPEKIESALILFYKKTTLERMNAHVSELRRQTGLHVSKVGVTMARRRWGSCSSRSSLNFSYRLAMVPDFVQRYLAVHEMAHLRHPNHSPAFWAQVADWMSEFRLAEKWLKNEGARLPL